MNIRLPWQRLLLEHQNSLRNSPSPGPAAAAAAGMSPAGAPLPTPDQYEHISLQPYIRRLVATGYDYPGVLHGFFGDDWRTGIAPLHEAERRNFMFAAKSANWLEVKKTYDGDEDEVLPFMKPLKNVTETEIVAAELEWSDWLAMQDWYVLAHHSSLPFFSAENSMLMDDAI